MVHCQPVGNGQKAFKYLAPYIFRVAISNSRLVSLENDQVTFRYRDSNTGQPKLLTLEAFEFIHRSLRVQHVLPKSFVKVRYYPQDAARGFLSPGCRPQLTLIRQQLAPAAVEPIVSTPAQAKHEPLPPVNPSTHPDADLDISLPDPTPSAAAPDTAALTTPADADTPPPDQSVLIELEDEPDSPTEPDTPPPSSSVPCCPTCGQPMRRRATLWPKGRSPP